MSPQLARELILTGEIVPASAMGGFVYKVVPPDRLLSTAKDLARRIATRGLVAIRLAKKALKASLYTPLEEGLKLEALYFAKTFETQDGKEGVAAFLEKREPKVMDK
jgi:enoyl-CoA hydratase